MASIGELVKQDDGSYTGFLSMVSFATPVRLAPVAAKKTATGPDFRLYGRAPNSRSVDIGAGWIKTRQDGSGETYVSLKIDAPELPNILYATLGQMAEQDDEDVMAIIWNRPNGQRG
jgi:uncharacterized protein (DUF736 family)